MDNGQLPPIQPTMPNSMPPSVSPQSIQGTPVTQSNQPLTPDGRPMVQQVNVLPKQKKSHIELIKTIVIIIISLIAVTFIGLFIWMSSEYNYANNNLQEEVGKAVALAKDEQASKDEAEFLEREKYPYKTFSGPVDYGQLTFEYPKTWSVYIAAAATKGGDFNAYFNPIQVDAVGKDTINALRVTIQDKSFENVTAQYQRELDRKDAKLTMEAITVNEAPANRYTGTIPGTDLSGYIVIFKIRDKTVIMQTDSVLFKDDFDKLLETVKFNA
ncbi:hypothetical protein IJI28_01725 [Candidatus Saccharibacteria bacterium]|nr:hypothetical protein [Candidatus Saccharibacteria bacterium]